MTTTKLRATRVKKGWSLVALCARTGISPSDLSAIERGQRPVWPGWRRRIAAAYGVPVAELFDAAQDVQRGAQ